MQVREASGVVPYLIKKDRLYVMLVKSSNGNRWVLPKGGLESDQTKKSNAAKEAYEEAGVILKPKIKLGSYEMIKERKELNKVYMFAGRIDEILDEYPEVNIRKRKLVTFNEAMKKLDPFQQVFLVKLYEAL